MDSRHKNVGTLRFTINESIGYNLDSLVDLEKCLGSL